MKEDYSISAEQVNSREFKKLPISYNPNEFLDRLCAIVMREIAESKIIWKGSEIVFQEKIKNRIRRLIPDIKSNSVRTCSMCGREWKIQHQNPRD